MYYKKIILIIYFFLIQIFSYSYRIFTDYNETTIVVILDLDDEGNLSLVDTINVNTHPVFKIMSPNGRFAFAHPGGLLSMFKIDSNQNVEYIGDPLNSIYFGSLTNDTKYLIHLFGIITLYRINDDLSLTNTGSYIQLNDNEKNIGSLRESIFNNTILGNVGWEKKICIFRRIENILFDTGERISIDPYNINDIMQITPDGRFCYGCDEAWWKLLCLEIFPDGSVEFKGIVANNIQAQDIVITRDSRHLLCISMNQDTLFSFLIESDGSLTFADKIENLTIVQSLAVTPDNKYVLVSWDYTLSGCKTSIIRLYSDGTLEKLDKDKSWLGCFSQIEFIPPYVTATDDEIWEMYK